MEHTVKPLCLGARIVQEHITVQETTDSTYFKLSPDDKYTMSLEIYVFNEDTVFNIYQKSTDNTIGARYVESSDFRNPIFLERHLKVYTRQSANLGS